MLCHTFTGGGLSLNYSSDTVEPTVGEYFRSISEHYPEFWAQKRRIITEFGRIWVGKAGAVIAKTEDILQANDAFTAIVHAGADLFLRTVICSLMTSSDLISYTSRPTARINFVTASVF